jgi:NADH:ubiquinone oxidoreductase subunit D
MDFYDRASGARMHSFFIRPGGVSQNINSILLNDIYLFLIMFEKRLIDIEEMLTSNRIWKERLINIGTLTALDALDWGFSGVMLRGSGVLWDLRLHENYEIYSQLSFNIVTGTNGDCFDRYEVRLGEMKESIKIIYQCLETLTTMPFCIDTNICSLIKNDTSKYVVPSKVLEKKNMESLIHHFKYYSEGFNVPVGEVYTATEAPKGEFGIYLISNGTNRPYRCKIKAPGFNHLQGLNMLAKNHKIADIVTIIGTLDIVFGEIDR